MTEDEREQIIDWIEEVKFHLEEQVEHASRADNSAREAYEYIELIENFAYSTEKKDELRGHKQS